MFLSFVLIMPNNCFYIDHVVEKCLFRALIKQFSSCVSFA